jgi:hypothetical protein
MSSAIDLPHPTCTEPIKDHVFAKDRIATLGECRRLKITLKSKIIIVGRFTAQLALLFLREGTCLADNLLGMSQGLLLGRFRHSRVGYSAIG